MQGLRIALSIGIVGLATALLAGESAVSRLPAAVGNAVRHKSANDREAEPNRLAERGTGGPSGPRTAYQPQTTREAFPRHR